ncbi:MAG: hypothetical protein ACPGVG_00535 [Mycobacterium sp.]
MSQGRQTALDNWKAYTRARDAGHSEYVREAAKFDRYYRGDQWDPADRQRLEAEGRPVLTINAILSVINAVLGEHSTQRASIAFKPRKNAAQSTADVMTKLALHVQDNNDYANVENTVVGDGLVEDRGYFDIRVDFSDNLAGDIKITAKDPRTVLPDPYARDYDPSTWNEVITTQWMTLDDVEVHYGKDKATELKHRDLEDFFGRDSVELEPQAFGDEYEGTMGSEYAGTDVSQSQRSVRRIRVIERQFRKLGRGESFVDPVTGDTSAVPEHWEPERVAAFAQKFGLQRLSRISKRIRWVVSAGDVVLHDDWSPYTHFTIVPFFPYFRRGKPFGMVRNLTSPQEQLNKTASQELHIVNTTANSGYAVEEGSLVNMTPEELEERGAETGIVITYAPGKEPPQKIKPNPVPTGITNIKHDSLGSLREIAGVSSEMLGNSGGEISGVTLSGKIGRGLVQLQVPFDNLGRSRRILARVMLDMIQSYYTDNRVFQITNWDYGQESAEDVEINGTDEHGEPYNDLSLGEYDITVSSQPARETFQDSQFAQAVEMRNAGIVVPDHVVIQNSNLENKHDIADMVARMTGFAPPTPEEVQMAQQEQQIAMQEAMLGLEELAAKVQQLQATAALTAAKAQSEGSKVEQAERDSARSYDAKIKALQAQMQSAVQEIQGKLALANVHTGANLQQTRFQEASKRLVEEIKARNAASLAQAPKDPNAQTA